MTVAFFNSNKTWGGGEKWHFNTAIQLKEFGFNIILVAQKKCELYYRGNEVDLRTFGMRITNFTFLNPYKLLQLILLFKRMQIDCIILNLSSDVKFAGLAAKLAGVKKIIYRRGLPVAVKNTWINRFYFRHVITHLIVNSLEIKNQVLKYNPDLIDNKKIFLIYNGIETLPALELSFNRIHTKIGHPVIIGNAGRISKEKGQIKLIEMAAILHDRKIAFSLIIAGDGELRKDLELMARNKGLSEHIIFKGFISDMSDFYNTIDIFVLTSNYEGCSNAILEAMNRGIPVVAFNNSSIPELVRNNITGFIAENNDVQDLAGKVEKLILDEELRNNFSMKAVDIVTTEFNQKKSLKKLIDLICNKEEVSVSNASTQF